MTSNGPQAIKKPLDEINFWNNVAKATDQTIDIRNVIEKYQLADLFETLQHQTLEACVNGLSVSNDDKSELSCQSLPDRLHDALDELYALYSQDRMKNFVLLICKEIGLFVVNKLKETDLWKEDNFFEAKKLLELSMTLLEKWKKNVEELTKLWENWKQGTIKDPALENLSQRIEKIYTIRSSVDELLTMMNKFGASQLPRPDFFEKLRKAELDDASSGSDSAWKAAVKDFEEKLLLFERTATDRVRQRLTMFISSPQLLINEFNANKNFLKRDAIKKELNSERNLILNKTMYYIQQMKNEFESFTKEFYEGRTTSSTTNKDFRFVAGRTFSKTVNSIVVARQYREKASKIQDFCIHWFDDFGEQQKNILMVIDKFLDDLANFEKENFGEWKKQIEEQKDDYQLTGNMIKIMKNQITNQEEIEVNYNEGLMSLLTEIRQLTILGFPIPEPIQKISKDAQDLLPLAMNLKQMVNFHKIAHTQVIKSQSTMLIQVASQFDQVFQEFKNKNRKWDKKKSGEDISQLKIVAEQFTKVNRALREYHGIICERVVELMEIDLLRKKEFWLDRISQIQKIFQIVKERGFNDMQDWKNHWDIQIFKAMQIQYQMGLESLNENLPDMKVSLIFKDKEVQYKPSVQKLKEEYYSKIKEFVEFPIQFRGISNHAIFKELPEMHKKELKSVFKKAHHLFQRMGKIQEKFSDYVLFGTVNDLEALVTSNLKNINDWSDNFLMIKEKGKEMEKIEDTIKVDCFTISTDSIKNSIDEQLQKVQSIMIKSLQDSAEQHLKVIDAFVQESMSSMNKEPQTMDEIGKCAAQCRTLSEEKARIKIEFENFEKKKKLLKVTSSISLDGGVSLSKYKDFEQKLVAQDTFLKKRTESLKKTVNDKILSFRDILAKFSTKWKEMKPRNLLFESDEKCKKDFEFISQKKKEFADFQSNHEDLKKESGYFGVQIPSQIESDLNGIKNEIADLEAIYGVYDAFAKELQSYRQEEWITFKKKAYVFEDFITNWASKIKTVEKNIFTIRIRELLDKFNSFKDIMKFLQGEGWTDDHWYDLFKKLDLPKDLKKDKLSFGHLLDKIERIENKLNEIKELNSRAQGEDRIRVALRDLKYWENKTEFIFYEYTNEKGDKTSLIKEWKEIMSEVGDNQSLVSSLKESPFVVAFNEEVVSWETKLSNLNEFLGYLNQIQRAWVYLEPIFARGSLPMEQKRFDDVNKQFRNLMQEVRVDPRVIQLSRSNLRDILKNIKKQLEICQKALAKFLEDKRGLFPRFYFIGDEDLLEILGQAKNPSIIQNHLKKLFAGIHHVGFDDQKKQIMAMKSSLSEEVPLIKPILLTEHVENWLSELDKSMKMTLEKLLVDCYSEEHLQLDKYPEQILCICAMINFTRSCENAINQSKLKEFREELKSDLSSYTILDPKDNKVLESKIKALVLDIIHNISIVELLLECNVKNVQDWSWQKQLRYYLESNKCVAKMCNARSNYTYEYQGNVQKLVHTPLTDKCFLTLTQGIHLGFGGCPYGPAGTGKTESVKALASLLGRQCLVMNCDKGIDFKSMGRIFIGLVKCGAWGCFDEFNRLKEDELSAVSQQIQVIQAAIKEKKQTPIELLGTSVTVNMNAGIFVTMNPAGKGYGGRSKLPDNLKQLFRSVAMTVPDNDLIAEVILFSEGFEHAKYVGKKLVSVFLLCKQLLSPQQHYDWGLRALKTVLGHGGKLIRQKKTGKDQRFTQEQEAKLIIKALRANTIGKLTADDLKLFDGVISDVFFTKDFEEISDEPLENAIQEALKQETLLYLPGQVKKVLQLHEALSQRMGVVLVGPSGSGKSTCWKILKRAIEIMHETAAKEGKKVGDIPKEVKTYIVNPKSMPREQLLGHLDTNTREWFDGVITSNSRRIIQEKEDVHSWIICDGDIDPEWIESLNSVLDDNRLLTMPNGERIHFGHNVNFVFETHSLQHASPATISRMGMLFLSEEDVDLNSLVSSWVKKQPAENQGILTTMINSFFFQALESLKRIGGIIVETSIMGLVKSGLSHLNGVSTKGEFSCGLVMGLGSYLPLQQRTELAREIYKLCGVADKLDTRTPLNHYYSRKDDRFYQYQTQPPTEPDFFLRPYFMTKTNEVQRAMDVLGLWIERQEPIIVIGPEGAGKTMILMNCFKEMKNTSITTLHCNSQTTAQNLIQKLNQSCTVFSSTKGRVLRPKEGEKLIVFLKDMNLAKPDQYETTQLIAFVHQLVSYQGYYDENLEWIGLEKIQIVASMNPSTTVGRYPLTTRLTSVVRVFSLDYPNRETIASVFGGIVVALFQKMFPGHKIWSEAKNLDLLTETMVYLYLEIVKSYTIDDHPHYVFTPRDLMNWILGIRHYSFSDDTSSPNEVIDVIINEARSIFRDKLVDRKNIYDAVEKKSMSEFTKLGYTSALTGNVYTSLANTDKNDKLTRRLELNDFNAIVKDGHKSYERENRKLDILFLVETVRFVAKLERVLQRDGGSLLLVQRPGMMCNDFIPLVCKLLKIQFFTPLVTADYDMKKLAIDLKTIMQVCGVENKPVVFMFEDHQLLLSSFLESINSLLSSGEISGLFTKEELDQICNGMSDQAQNENMTPYSLFVSRVQKNLRIVLVMDPTNKTFNAKCQSNPALYTKCTILWVDSFTDAGMKQIPKQKLAEIIKNNKNLLSQQILDQILSVHDAMVKAVDVPPIMFLQLINNFSKILMSKRQDKIEHQQHLQLGLSKLNEAAADVDKLSREAAEQKKLLAIKQEEKKKALQDIQISAQESAREQNEAEKLQQKMTIEEKKLKEKEAIIKAEIDTFMPALAAAQEAVKNISWSEVDFIKSLPKPTEDIQLCMFALASLLYGLKSPDYKLVKKEVFYTRNLKLDIDAFDVNNLDEEKLQNLQRTEVFLKKYQDIFEKKNMEHVSKAACSFSEWVKANVSYRRVLQRVEPITNEKKVLEQDQKQLKDKLQTFETKIEDLKVKIERLNKEFTKKTEEAYQIELGVKKAESTLQAAQTLLSKLGGERERWNKQSKEETEMVEKLPAYSLLAAAFITYLGSEPEDIRKQYLDSFSQILNIKNFDFQNFMSSESTMLQYKGEGLPSDELSKENSIIILESQIVPLIIDPAQQASGWIVNHFKSNQNQALEITTPQDPKFLTNTELAIRFGKTLVIKEVDKIDPVLFPMLRKEFISQGTRLSVFFGDKTIDVGDGFKLFLITRNPSIELSPDSKFLVSSVNFTVTRSGLEGQLLGITIQHENPELEIKKTELLRKEEEDKLALTELENQLLHELVISKGNILENVTLIEKLNDIKQKSQVIAKSLEESHNFRADLEKKRSAYRQLAFSGSKIFFLINDLKKVESMYQFSLSTFLNLFIQSLEPDNSNKNFSLLDLKIAALVETLQKNVYYYIARSLFKADRLLFAIHLVHGLFETLFGPKEWDFFINNIISAKNTTIKESQIPGWVGSEHAEEFKNFYAAFPDLVSKLDFGNYSKWSSFMQKDHSHIDDVLKQTINNNEVTGFQRLLLVKVLRPDHLLSCMTNFVKTGLQIQSLSPPNTNLVKVFEAKETSAKEPILLITTPGTDPSQDIIEVAKFAKKKKDKDSSDNSNNNGEEEYIELAMSQGQTNEALMLLRKCAKNGYWLVLKNLHLVRSWLPILEKEISMLSSSGSDTCNPDFRLWLTCESNSNFPVVLLRSSLKITFEAPPGIKQNLLRTFDTWSSSDSFLDNVPKIRNSLLFVLAWFHSIVQERRSYIPQGWTKFYEFSSSDLRAAVDIITEACSKGTGEPDWATIYGLLENAVYGGKIDNDYDNQVLKVYLRQFFQSGIASSKDALFKSLKVPQPPPNGSLKIRDFISAIEKVADENSPKPFGLPENAGRVVSYSAAQLIVEKMKTLSVPISLDNSDGTDDGSGGKNLQINSHVMKNWSEIMFPLVDFWKSLISEHTKLFFANQNVKATESTTLKKAMSTKDLNSDKFTPINAFVALEIQSSLQLVSFIDTSLHNIEEVLKGNTLIESTILSDVEALLLGRVPSRWEEKWENGPSAANSWLKEVVNKTISLCTKWKPAMEQNTLISQTFNLRDLFHPDIFLNAFKQQTARVTKQPLDELNYLSSSFVSASNSKNGNSKFSFSVKMCGLFVQGCGFDGDQLIPLGANSPSVSEIGVCEIAWTSSPKNSKSISLPVYFSSTRERVLTEFHVPCEEPERWILSGVALFSN